MKNLIQSIKLILFDTKCNICGENIYDKEYEICYNCFSLLKKKRQLRSFGKVYYCFDYSRDFRKLLLMYKNNNKASYAKTIAMLIKDELIEVICREDIDMVIPVPISSKRRRDRGFNQVEEVLNLLGIRYKQVERSKNTKKMYKLLDEEARIKNIEGSFTSCLDVEARNILLVDDVVTTGSTFRELKKVINSVGKAKKITYFSFALSKTAYSNRMRGVVDVTQTKEM